MRYRSLFASLVALTFVAGWLAACGGGADDPEVTDEDWVSGFCAATLRLDEAVPRLTPGTGGSPEVTSEWLKTLAPLYQTYAEDLEELGAPSGLENFFADFLDAIRETSELLAEGDTTVDAFRPLEEVPQAQGTAERFGPIALEDPVCQQAEVTFDYVPPGETETPGTTPGGSTFQPPRLDYESPELFLEGGPQSTLSAESIEALMEEVMPAQGEGAARIHRWISSTFTTRPSGGATIGEADVNSLIETRMLGGCHDWALVMTSALRYFGYPAVMVDAAGLQWAEDFAAGRTQSFAGHVFAEVLTNEGWMLVDCSGGAYTLDYDPEDPVLSYTGAGDTRGFFALFKGIDPASYGVTSNQVLQQRMTAFATALPGLDITLPDYEWRSFD